MTTAIFCMLAATTAKSLQSCPTLCDPTDGSPPGLPGIFQARTLEWVAISFSNACKWKVKVKTLSHIRPSATPWTAAFQAPPSIGFSRQEYWSGVPLPSPSVCLLCTKLYWMFPLTLKTILWIEVTTAEVQDFPGGPVVKNLPVNAGDTGLIPALGESHTPQGN